MGRGKQVKVEHGDGLQKEPKDLCLPTVAMRLTPSQWLRLRNAVSGISRLSQSPRYHFSAACLVGSKDHGVAVISDSASVFASPMEKVGDFEFRWRRID